MIRGAFCSWERVPEFRKPKLLLAAMAEFCGTFALMVVSVGAIRFSRADKISQLSFSYGLVLAALVCMFGRVSGGNFNPATTLSFALVGKIPLTHALLYFLMQLTAAVLASYFLTLTSNRLHDEVDFHVFTNFDESLCIPEAIATFLIVLVTLTAYGSKGGICREPSCLVAGLAMVGFCFFLWDYTGSCLNPLRAFGPAFVQDNWTRHFYTWVGPMVGGLFAAIVYEIMPKPFDCERDEDEEEEEEDEARPSTTLGRGSGNPITTFVDNFWRVMLS